MPEIDQYRISELDTAINLNNNDLVEISQENQSSESGYSSAKATLAALATKIANNTLFPTELKTATVTLIGAINSVLENLADDFSTSSTYAVGDCVIYGGKIYQCNTAIVTPGAWDSTKWSEVKATDVGSGGGGGGGHTIVDGQGTSLTQRSMLQFLGAYSEDDSAADTTKVNVVRSMTKAAYNQLSADEKVGLIEITDEDSVTATEIPIESGSATNTKDYIDNSLPVYITQVTGTSVQFLVTFTFFYYYADQWQAHVPFPFIAKNTNYSITLDDVVAENIGNVLSKCSVIGKSASYFDIQTTKTMTPFPNTFSTCVGRCRFTITFA